MIEKNKTLQLISGDHARIDHLEDLIFKGGSEAISDALDSLNNLNSNNLSLKWDGSPAVIFGRNNNGDFIFTDKNRFGAKSYDGKATSPEQLAKVLNRKKDMSHDRITFVNNMVKAFNIIKSRFPSNIRGYFFGDMLYFNTPMIKNALYYFRPNVVTYSIDKNSEYGTRVELSKIGIAVHSFINLDGSVREPGISTIQHNSDVFFIPPVHPNTSNLNLRGIFPIQSMLKRYGKTIDEFINNGSNLKLVDVMYTYSNSLPKTPGNNFFEWLNNNTKISPVRKDHIREYIDSKNNIWHVIWIIINRIIVLKTEILRVLENEYSLLPIHQQINNINVGEGFVLNDNIKIVDRQVFTNINRIKNDNGAKMESFKTFIEGLSFSGRKKLARKAKLRKNSLKLARKRAKKRVAPMKKLLDRARKRARANVASFLLKGKSKSSLSAAGRSRLEKRIIGRNTLVKQKTKKFLPNVRKSDRRF